MTEEELQRMGFFKMDPTLPGMERAHMRLKLFESYKGVFLRIIVSKYKDVFIVDHIYFDSPKSDELQLELFGTDLSIENVVSKLKTYRENIGPSEEQPETF